MNPVSASVHPPYENVYGVSLLDDLHNYFPALLYDSSSFLSVQDLLTYVQAQARNRFDLYSRASRRYAAAASASAAAAPARSPVAAYYTPTFAWGNPSTLPGHTFTAHVVEETDEAGAQEAELNTLTSRLLLQLLSLPHGPLTRTTQRTNMDAFLNPVIVRPTTQQITENTIIGNLASDEPYTCAICQDSLLPEQQARKILSCGHWFHRGCIDPWFQRNVHCPVCRHDIRDPTPAGRVRTSSPE
jgi:hypothetical protein